MAVGSQTDWNPHLQSAAVLPLRGIPGAQQNRGRRPFVPLLSTVTLGAAGRHLRQPLQTSAKAYAGNLSPSCILSQTPPLHSRTTSFPGGHLACISAFSIATREMISFFSGRQILSVSAFPRSLRALLCAPLWISRCISRIRQCMAVFPLKLSSVLPLDIPEGACYSLPAFGGTPQNSSFRMNPLRSL